MTYCIIKCTTANKEEAIKIAKYLVEKGLVACCNIIPSITSVYKWEDKLCCDDEALMVIKTRTTLFSKVETAIKELHSYDVPEIICTKIVKGNKEYIDWIEKQTINVPV